MKKFGQFCFLTLLFLTSSHFLLGQHYSLVDNLKLKLNKERSDTGKIPILLAIADEYCNSDTKIAFNYIMQAKKIAEHVNDQKYMADILLQEGIIVFNETDFPKALAQIEKALSIYKSINMKSKIAKCYLWLGHIAFDSANYSNAITYYSEAMNLYKLIQDNKGLSLCYKSMAKIYCKQTKDTMAVEFAKKSIMLADKSNKPEMAKLYLNLFIYYHYTKEYNKSLMLVDSIFPALKEVNDFSALGKAYINLGNLYVTLKNDKKAKECFLQSIYYDSKLENLNNLISANICLADIYNHANMLDSAIIVLNKAIDMNKQIKNSKFDERIYYTIYQVYEKKGDAKSALAYYKNYIGVNYSINEDLNNKKLLEIQTKYEVNLKNEQIKLLVKEKQLTNHKIIASCIGLFVVIMVVLYYRYRKAKERKLLREIEMNETAYKHELELKEASHIVGIKQRELTYKAIHISQQENILSHIRDQLENFKTENSRTKETILSLLSGINQQLKQNAFEDFERYFVEVHPDFFINLKQNYPELSQNELKVSALIRLNLNSKQIANITGKTVRSVDNTRYSIRKKMNLSLQDNLFEIISTF